MSDEMSTPDQNRAPTPPEESMPPGQGMGSGQGTPPAERMSGGQESPTPPMGGPQPAPEMPPPPEPMPGPGTPPPPRPMPGPEMPPPPYPPTAYTPPPPPPYTPPVEVMPMRPGPATESSKILAALSYIFAIIAIVVLFVEPYKDEKFVRFHAIQGIGLWVLGIFYWIPFVGWILGLIALVAIIIGAIKAFQGQYWEVPLLYDVVKSFIDR